jgi:LysM repeat protein
LLRGFLRENPGAKKKNKPQKKNRKHCVNMNTPSPLIPQGATPPRGKTSLYFKVLMVVSVHVVLIGGMLLQGCKDTTNKDAANNSPGLNQGDTTPLATNPALTPAPAPQVGEAPATIPPTLNPNISNVLAGGAVTSAPSPQPLQPAGIEAPKAPETAPPPAVGEKEYVVVSGDRLGAIAHRNGISLKALMDANPGVNAKKLKIGQKLQIPASMAAVAAAPGASADSSGVDTAVYTVKSGDILLRIAKTHGTTVKKIMALNDLKTTSIRAGQKLKLPAKTVSSEPAAAPAAAAIPPAMAPVTRVSAVASPVASN